MIKTIPMSVLTLDFIPGWVGIWVLAHCPFPYKYKVAVYFIFVYLLLF